VLDRCAFAAPGAPDGAASGRHPRPAAAKTRP